MAVQKIISREYRIYLALWRKAIQSPETVRIKASSFAMAIAMRQGMYRAIRPFRNGQMNDEQLRDASEKFVVYLEKNPDPKEEHHLILKARAALSELEASFDTFGIDEEDLLFGDERDTRHSLAEFLDETPAVKPITSTPFYSRED